MNNQFSTNTHSPTRANKLNDQYSPQQTYPRFDNNRGPLPFNQNMNQQGNFRNQNMRGNATEPNIFNNMNVGRNGFGMGNNRNVQSAAVGRNRTISPGMQKRLNFDDYERNLLTNRRYKMENMNRNLGYGQGSVMSGSADYSEDDYGVEEDGIYSDDSSFVTDESVEEGRPMSVFSRKVNRLPNSRALSPKRGARSPYGRMALSPMNHKESHNRAGSISKQMKPKSNRRFSSKRRRKSKAKNNMHETMNVNQFVNQAQAPQKPARNLNMNHIEGTSYRPAYNMIRDDKANGFDQGASYRGNLKQSSIRSPGKKRGKRRPGARVQANIGGNKAKTFGGKKSNAMNGSPGNTNSNMRSSVDLNYMTQGQEFGTFNSNMNYGYSSLIKDTQDNSHIYKGKTFYEKIVNNQFEGMHSPAWNDYLRNSKEELVTVKNVQKIIKGQRFSAKKLTIPGKHKGITLLLDLDETLIHSEEKKPGVKYDAELQLTNPRGIVEHIGVRIRPYCTEFLERMSQKFEVVVFTAGKQEYAEQVIKKLDPHNKYFTFSLFRQNCSKAHQFHIKDFRVIGNRKIKNMVLVDNLLYSFAANFENGIPIKPYIMGKDDWELMYLADVLSKLNDGDDVSKFLIENMKLYHFYQLLAK